MPIYGALGLRNGDRSLVSSVGESIVYDAVQEFVRMHNENLISTSNLFIQGMTERFKDIYKMPGSGRLQRRNAFARTGAVRPGSEWDVAYPLEEFGVAIEGDVKAYAMLTVEELANELITARIQDINTVRWEVLSSFYNNENRVVVDQWPGSKGSLTIRTLANGDGTMYMPLSGTDLAERDNYVVSGYADTAIDDTNNPVATIVEKLGSNGNAVVFINKAQRAKVEALTNFVDATPAAIMAGSGRDTLRSAPTLPSKAELIGYTDSAWVAVWDEAVPPSYVIGVDADQPGPYMMRVHRSEYDLPQGLALVVTDERYPIRTRHWEHDFGIGAGNRVNGAVVQLKAAGTYDVPAQYVR